MFNSKGKMGQLKAIRMTRISCSGPTKAQTKESLLTVPSECRMDLADSVALDCPLQG